MRYKILDQVHYRERGKIKKGRVTFQLNASIHNHCSCGVAKARAQSMGLRTRRQRPGEVSLKAPSTDQTRHTESSKQLCARLRFSLIKATYYRKIKIYCQSNLIEAIRICLGKMSVSQRFNTCRHRPKSKTHSQCVKCIIREKCARARSPNLRLTGDNQSSSRQALFGSCIFRDLKHSKNRKILDIML